MSTQVINYHCPACDAPLHFVGASGRLECEYCGSSYEVAEIEALYAEKEAKAAEATQKEQQKEQQQQAVNQNDQQAEQNDSTSQQDDAAEETEWDLSDLQEDWDSDGEGMKSYSCPSCGAEIICDATTAATSCPYCGNPSIVPGQLSGVLKPDYIIPFKLSKEDAVKALKKHYGKKPLLPKVFSEANHIEEVKGVYVPFWLFDAKAEGSAIFDATRSHSHRSGDYRITETDHFAVSRSGELAFEKVPVDASSKMPDDYMDSIEPFDYSELKPFMATYLPGFLADKYDVSAKDCYERADERCKSSFVSALKDSVTGYQTCIKRESHVRLNRGKVHYALLPVWLLSTKWKDKDFLFAMNGQTGRLVGDLPASGKRVLGLFAAIAVPLMAIGITAVLWLMQ